MPTEHVVTTYSVPVDSHSPRCCNIQHSPYSLYNTSVYLCTYIAQRLTVICLCWHFEVSLQDKPTISLIIIRQFVWNVLVSLMLSRKLVVIDQDWQSVHIEINIIYISGGAKKWHSFSAAINFYQGCLATRNFTPANFKMSLRLNTVLKESDKQYGNARGWLQLGSVKMAF